LKPPCVLLIKQQIGIYFWTQDLAANTQLRIVKLRVSEKKF